MPDLHLPQSELPTAHEHLQAWVAGGTLTVQVSEGEVRFGDHRGVEQLVRWLVAEGQLASVVGRLDLELLGFVDDPRRMGVQPDKRRWLVQLQQRLPWLAAWMRTDPPSESPAAFQLVGARAPWRFEEGYAVLGADQFATIASIGGTAWTWAERLGVEPRPVVQPFLELFSLGRLPRNALLGADVPALDDEGFAIAGQTR